MTSAVLLLQPADQPKQKHIFDPKSGNHCLCYVEFEIFLKLSTFTYSTIRTFMLEALEKARFIDTVRTFQIVEAQIKNGGQNKS